MAEGLQIRRRYLPHWRIDYATYFVTWCKWKQCARLDESDRGIVLDSIMHFHRQRYHIWGYVVMDDHAHVLVTPMGFDLSRIVRTWKSFSARMINRRRGRSGRFWQPEFYDRVVRNEMEFREKLAYILTNPVRRWLEARDYKWVGWTKDEFSYKPPDTR